MSERLSTLCGLALFYSILMAIMESSSRREQPIVVPEITATNSSDAETEAAVAPTPTGDLQFQRLQMQEELAHFRMLVKSGSSGGSSLSIIDDGGSQQIFLPNHEARSPPTEISTITRKKKKSGRRRTKKKNTRSNQKSLRDEKFDNKSAVFSEELTETLLKPPEKGKVTTAGTFPVQTLEANPMLAAMLRQIDFAGVVWNEDNETGWDQRGPLEIQPVTVAVEATAISNFDLAAQGKCLLPEDDMLEPNGRGVLGNSFVGVVLRCSKQNEERYSIQAGGRVASIVHWGGNAKYVSVPANHLVAVPRHLDSADIASLVSFYLPAFETLNFGRPRPLRYSSTSLMGKKVFITSEGASLEVQALIQLARIQGSREIFVTAPIEHHELLRKLGVATLNENPGEWQSFIASTMDVVVDMSFPKNFSAVKSLVAPGGCLVCSPRPQQKLDRLSLSCTPTVPAELSYLLERSQLSMMDRATLFVYSEYVSEFRQEVLKDVDFLITLLSTRKIRPSVDRFITLKDISDAYKELEQNRPMKGAIICEPWKEH